MIKYSIVSCECTTFLVEKVKERLVGETVEPLGLVISQCITENHTTLGKRKEKIETLFGLQTFLFFFTDRPFHSIFVYSGEIIVDMVISTLTLTVDEDDTVLTLWFDALTTFFVLTMISSIVTNTSRSRTVSMAIIR